MPRYIQKMALAVLIFSEHFDPDLRLSSIFDSLTLSGVGIVKFEVSISVASKKGLWLFWLDSYEREEHALFSKIFFRFLNPNYLLQFVYWVVLVYSISNFFY